jgi:hypothetical protein
MKTNKGLEWYQSTAYDFPISRLVFFYLKSLVPLNLNKRFSAAK